MFIKARRINRSTAPHSGVQAGREGRGCGGYCHETLMASQLSPCLGAAARRSAFLTCLVIKIISHNVRKRRQQITTKSARPKSFNPLTPQPPSAHCRPPWCPVKRASGNYLARHNNLASPLIGQVGRTSSDSCGRRETSRRGHVPEARLGTGKSFKVNLQMAKAVVINFI